MDPYAALPLPPGTRSRLHELAALLREWNAKLNLVSRQDIVHLEARHLAPSLAPLRFLQLAPGATVLDAGTGGGLPGLPLAIAFPHAKFTLVDSIGKKIHAVGDIARRLGLTNLEARQARVEELPGTFDFVLARAVAALPQLVAWIRPRLRVGAQHTPANGLLCWKGGDLTAEFLALGVAPRAQFALEEIFGDPYFHEKYLLHFATEDLRRASPFVPPKP